MEPTPFGIFRSHSTRGQSILAWSSAGLVALSVDTSLLFIEPHTLQFVNAIEHYDIITAILWDDGHLQKQIAGEFEHVIFCGDKSGVLRAWNLQTGVCFLKTSQQITDSSITYQFPQSSINIQTSENVKNIGIDKLLWHPSRSGCIFAFSKGNVLCLHDILKQRIEWSLNLQTFPEEIFAFSVNTSDSSFVLCGKYGTLFFFNDCMRCDDNHTESNTPTPICQPMSVHGTDSQTQNSIQQQQVVAISFPQSIPRTVLVQFESEAVLFDFIVGVQLTTIPSPFLARNTKAEDISTLYQSCIISSIGFN
ncbi:MAG: hypothetical protein EZS28_014266 [Streblomastix strix]|uniref:Uncharacterized protein n=1 Tax=Streblomastix strix TaxID=222440 RepID=A0A5J4W5T1_9EUKA|nr:MAG: hypothetical protein EZS28_014266 [Streblomastix strix]